VDESKPLPSGTTKWGTPEAFRADVPTFATLLLSQARAAPGAGAYTRPLFG